MIAAMVLYRLAVRGQLPLLLMAVGLGVLAVLGIVPF